MVPPGQGPLPKSKLRIRAFPSSTTPLPLGTAAVEAEAPIQDCPSCLPLLELSTEFHPFGTETGTQRFTDCCVERRSCCEEGAGLVRTCISLPFLGRWATTDFFHCTTSTHRITVISPLHPLPFRHPENGSEYQVFAVYRFRAFCDMYYLIDKFAPFAEGEVPEGSESPTWLPYQHSGIIRCETPAVSLILNSRCISTCLLLESVGTVMSTVSTVT